METERRREQNIRRRLHQKPRDSSLSFSPINLEFVIRACITRLVCLTSGKPRSGGCVHVCGCVVLCVHAVDMNTRRLRDTLLCLLDSRDTQCLNREKFQRDMSRRTDHYCPLTRPQTHTNIHSLNQTPKNIHFLSHTHIQYTNTHRE